MGGLVAAVQLFAVFLLLHKALADLQPSSDVQMSLDGGATWVDSSPSTAHLLLPLDTDVMFRLRSSSSFVSLPSCAATSGPATIAWRGIGAIGVRSELACQGGKDSFEKLNADLAYIVPEWHHFLHEPDMETESVSVQRRSNETSSDKDKKKQDGFWGNYGLYIAAFVAASLLQGIREGNAQYQLQLDDEKREKEARQAGAAPKTKIVVPRRKGGKGKKATVKKA